MSTTTTESTITPQYLRNKTKEDIIDITMMILNREGRLIKRLESLVKQWERPSSATVEGQAMNDCGDALNQLIEMYAEGEI